ncbi:MAG: hypothetical protein IJ626_01055, partial [Muribaculaceae bacterium]|nr:hypothetical protein [Muribaculaceae bacterium]
MRANCERGHGSTVKKNVVKNFEYRCEISNFVVGKFCTIGKKTEDMKTLRNLFIAVMAMVLA